MHSTSSQLNRLFGDKYHDNVSNSKPESCISNNFLVHVGNYLGIKLNRGAIAGPYNSPPFANDTHISPFVSKPKADSENRRIIIDLSWPLQDSIILSPTPPHLKYLHECYLTLQYPTVHNITKKFRSFGNEAVLYRIDLSGAFIQLRIDTSGYNLLCLE